MAKFKTMKILFLILGLLLLSKAADACVCAGRGSFLEVAPKAKLVAYVKIIKQTNFKNELDTKFPEKMEAEIIQVYQGEEKRKTIIIWGSRGKDCKVQISQFQEGKNYLIAFEAESEKNKRDKTKVDYSISSCGTYFLPVETLHTKYTNPYAVGDIGNQKVRMDLNEIKQILNK